MRGTESMLRLAKLGAVLVATAALSWGAVAASALPPDGAGSSTPGTSSRVSPSSLKAGGLIAFQVSGFPAGQTVNIKIDDGLSCSAVATHGACVVHAQKIGSGGSATGQFKLPSDLPAGQHWLRFLASEPIMKDGKQAGTKGYTNKSPSFTVTAASKPSSKPTATKKPTTKPTTTKPTTTKPTTTRPTTTRPTTTKPTTTKPTTTKSSTSEPTTTTSKTSQPTTSKPSNSTSTKSTPSESASKKASSTPTSSATSPTSSATPDESSTPDPSADATVTATVVDDGPSLGVALAVGGGAAGVAAVVGGGLAWWRRSRG